MAFQTEADARIVLHHLGEVVKNELGIVAEVGLAGNELGRIEVLFNLRNLLDIERVVNNNDFLHHLGLGLFIPEDEEAKAGNERGANEPDPPGDAAFLGFRGNIAVEVFQAETAFLTAAGSLFKVRYDDAILLGPGDQTLKTGFGPHRDDRNFLAIAHRKQFVFCLEEAVPIAGSSFIFGIDKILLDAGVGIEAVREGFANIFQLGLGVHHHIGVHNAEGRAVLRFSIDSDASAFNICLGCLDLRSFIVLPSLGLFCRFFSGRGFIQKLGKFVSELLRVPFLINFKTGGVGDFAQSGFGVIACSSVFGNFYRTILINLDEVVFERGRFFSHNNITRFN